MALKLIIFDMAGTTVHDSDNVHEALIKAFSQFGYDINREDANSVMGIPKPVAIRVLLTQKFQLEPSPDDIDAIFREFEDNMLYHYRTSPDVRPTPFAERTIRTLRKIGAKVALNTGFSSDITNTIIDRLDWHEMVDAWVSADRVERGRPHPDMIQQLMQKFGITDPTEVAKVGDTPADLQEGTNAGCGWVIGVTSGSHTREELEPYPHTHLVDDIWQVVQITVDEFAHA
ncbi:MAG: HAD-IA family hydrolase [Saprospiraceae bacterium]|nr:HAD-IA family hydrolase [Saprospiraceae bacterium]